MLYQGEEREEQSHGKKSGEGGIPIDGEINVTGTVTDRKRVPILASKSVFVLSALKSSAHRSRAVQPVFYTLVINITFFMIGIEQTQARL